MCNSCPAHVKAPNHAHAQTPSQRVYLLYLYTHLVTAHIHTHRPNKQQDLAVFDDTWGYPTECTLTTKRHSTRLRVGDVAWVKAIQAQISQCREAELLAQVAKTTPPTALLSTSVSSSSAALTATMQLDQRGKVLAYMHASEGTYLQYLRTAIRVVIAPLDDLAKGAGLLVGEGAGSESGLGGLDGGEGDGGRAQGLFESKVREVE